MRKILFILSVPLFFSCSNLKYLNAFDGFKGKPKEVITTSYIIKYEDILIKEEFSNKLIYYYDSKGRRLKNISIKSDGSVVNGGWSYFYDRKGNMIQDILYANDTTINIQNKRKYNKYGQVTERTYFYGNIMKSKSDKIYDRKERTMKSIGRNADSTFKHSLMVKFDKNWNKIETITYDENGKQKRRIEFEYDVNYNEIKSKWYDSQNNLYEYYNKTFNSKNDRVRIEKYKIQNGIPILISDTMVKYKYDGKGNYVEKKSYLDGKLYLVVRNKYKYAR